MSSSYRLHKTQYKYLLPITGCASEKYCIADMQSAAFLCVRARAGSKFKVRHD